MATQTLQNEQRDGSWVRQALFIPNRGVNTQGLNESRKQHILRAREYSPGVLNFADTTLGGNRSINPRPQFTEFADPNMECILTSASSRSELTGVSGANLLNGGMGRRYNEMFDANANRIFMDFGVPMYNSLGNFFSRFYDHDMGLLANQGIMSGLCYTAGKFIGYVFLFPVVIAMKIGHVVEDIYRYLRHIPSSRYYYMKPTMHVYWTMVTTITTAMMVNMGLIPGYDPLKYQQEKTLKMQANDGKPDAVHNERLITDEEFAAYQKILPDIFRLSSGGIDARAVATRYQRLANAHQQEISNITKDARTVEESYQLILDYVKNNKSKNFNALDNPSILKYIAEYKASNLGTGKGVIDISIPAQTEEERQAIQQSLLDATTAGEVAEGAVENITRSIEAVKNIAANMVGIQTNTVKAAVPQAEQNNAEAVGTTKGKDGASASDIAHAAEAEGNAGNAGSETGFWDGIGDFMEENGEFFMGTVRDGMAWVSFIVDHHNNFSESFSNSTRSSSIADSMNQTASEAKNMIFNVAGGNIGDNLAADVFESFMGGVKSVFQGVMNSVGLQGLNALGGAAFADIPDFWDSSSTNLPQNSYTIQLRSPYGNPMSLFINIYFPLAMILAGAVPRSTGGASYTSPFLCRLWHKGRAQVQLGIISDLTVSRGQGNIGWNTRDQATAIDVSFSITNLSKMLHMPITTEVGLKDAFGFNLFNEDNNFTDYMAVLAGLGLPEQFYRKANLIRQWHQSRANWDSWFTMTNFYANMIHGDFLPGNLMNGLAKDASFY